MLDVTIRYRPEKRSSTCGVWDDYKDLRVLWQYWKLIFSGPRVIREKNLQKIDSI
jgi:hypothetical protein